MQVALNIFPKSGSLQEIFYLIMFFEIEAAIVQQLSPLQDSGLQVLAFPDNPQALGRPAPKGQVLVGYKSDQLDPPGSINSSTIIQKQTIEFEVSIQLKNLRNHSGVYPVMVQIQELLTGFKPIGHQTQAMYKVRGGFVDISEGTWFYSMVFACPLSYLRKL